MGDMQKNICWIFGKSSPILRLSTCTRTRNPPEHQAEDLDGLLKMLALFLKNLNESNKHNYDAC